jgi:hypothetical protein
MPNPRWLHLSHTRSSRVLEQPAAYEDRYLVCLVSLVCLVEGDRLDEQNRPDEPQTKRTVCLNIMVECFPVVPHVETLEALACHNSFSAIC